MKMEQEAIYFGENDNIKSASCENKTIFNINELNTEKAKLSDKNSYCKDLFEHFFGYRHEGNAFPSQLCIKFPQMNVYTKYYKILFLLIQIKNIIHK